MAEQTIILDLAWEKDEDGECAAFDGLLLWAWLEADEWHIQAEGGGGKWLYTAKGFRDSAEAKVGATMWARGWQEGRAASFSPADGGSSPREAPDAPCSPWRPGTVSGPDPSSASPIPASTVVAAGSTFPEGPDGSPSGPTTSDAPRRTGSRRGPPPGRPPRPGSAAASTGGDGCS